MKTGLGKYDVSDVAEYILWYSEKKLEKPISNLQLQKILYYIQGEYIDTYNDPLFNNIIEAWEYGPVVTESYYTYSHNARMKIKGVKPKKLNYIDKEDKILIREVVRDKIQEDIWDIVEQTHTEYPWKSNYIKYENNIISLEDIEYWFKKGRYEE